MSTGQPMTRGQSFDRGRAARSIGLSLVVNGLCPFLLYRTLQAHFPSGSLMPLLCGTIFPAFALILGLARRRAVDAIAIIAMLSITGRIAVTLVTADVVTALVVRSFEGALIGLAFVTSTIIGRPIILLAINQAVVAGSPKEGGHGGAFFEKVGQRAFFHDNAHMGSYPDRHERSARSPRA